MPALYIADGHHRSAAAALVGAEKARQNPDHRGDEEYNYFMAVCFQASQLTILDYNRVVKDLNGMSSEEFLAALAKNFVVEDKGTECYKPQRLHEFSLYLDGRWYSLKAKEGTFNDADPIGVLDVDISSRLILDACWASKTCVPTSASTSWAACAAWVSSSAVSTRARCAWRWHSIPCRCSRLWTSPIPVKSCRPRPRGLNRSCAPGW